jgi:uncharacterized damage-inducible protein DinB
MTLRNYLSYFDTIIESTEKLLRMIPPDKLDWKPTENSFTFGQQLAHLSGAIGVYGRGIAGGDWGFKSMRDRFVLNRHTTPIGIEEAITSLQSNYAEFKDRVGGLSEEEFNNGEIDSPQLGRVARWRLAMLAVEHHLNHKAELFMYLKLLGAKVNTGNLYGPPSSRQQSGAGPFPA